jgi:hypothetical protein
MVRIIDARGDARGMPEEMPEEMPEGQVNDITTSE